MYGWNVFNILNTFMENQYVFFSLPAVWGIHESHVQQKVLFELYVPAFECDINFQQTVLVIVIVVSSW